MQNFFLGQLVPLLSIAIGAGLTIGACFPKLPPEDADAADAADSTTDIATPDIASQDAAPDAQIDATTTPETTVGPDATGTACSSINDCAAFEATCMVVACTDNVCTVGPASDTTTCDDGNACTENDVCAAGVCAGTAKTCPAVSQCHNAGTCDPGTGSCSTPTKLDGTGCNDDNQCTVTDTCRVGICTGTGKPPVVDHTIILTPDVLAGDKSMNLEGLVSTRAATWVAAWSTASVDVYYDTENRLRILDVADGGCLFTLFRWRSATASPESFVLGGYAEACPQNQWTSAGFGASPLQDDSFVIGGLASGKLPLSSGRTRLLGESPTGLSHNSAFWIARVSGAGNTLWTVEAQGFLGQSFAEIEIPQRTLSSNSHNDIAVAIPILGGVGGAELVDGSGQAVQVEAIDGEAGSIIYMIDLQGNVQEFARVTAAPGGAIVSALRLLDDRRMIVFGVAAEGVLNIEASSGATTQVPTGIGGEAFEPWVALLNADGSVEWSWHIFVRPSFSGPSPNDDIVKALPFVLEVGDRSVWFAVSSGKPVDGRRGTSIAEALSTSWPPTSGFRTTLIELDRETGELKRSSLLRSSAVIATAGTVFRNSAYVAGVVDGAIGTGWNEFVPDSNTRQRPFVAGIDRWSQLVATSSTQDRLVDPFDAILQPLLSANPDALFIAYQTDDPFQTLGQDGPKDVDKPGIGIRRLNENSALDCE